MMKRIYLLATIVGVLLSLSACGNGWLDDMQPVTQSDTEKGLVTDTDVEYAMNGIYTVFRQYEYYGARYTYYGDAKGEDMQARGDTKRVARYYLFSFNAANSPSSFWNVPYQVIRNANRILDFIDNKASEGELSDKLKDVKGHALTARAMAHFDLVKIYGLPYTKNNGASPGIPVVTKIVGHDYKPARNTVAEVYDQVIKDLKEGATYITTKKNDGKLNWYANQLLLARAYLYKGDNENAYTISSELIKSAESNGYRLFTNAEYKDAWKQKTGSEYFYVIFNSAEEISDSKEFVSYLMHRSGYDDISLSTDYINLITEDKNDVRIKIIDRYKTDRDYLLKYVSPDYKVSNIPVLRISEAYLIAAEAAIKQNDKPNAAKYLNAIVSRANPAKSVPEEEVTLDRVLTERRKELVGEGHRFFDALRNNKVISRKGKSHNSANLDAQTKEYDWDFYKIVLPIPAGEIKANSNIKQNDGYGD